MASRSLLLFFALFLAPAADWPGWRGPTGDGTAVGTGYPVTWSATENVKWKTPIPGSGHSSPIIVGNKIFVTACLDASKERVLHCFQRGTGVKLWSRVVVTAELEKKHKLNSFASSTPAADAERVFVTFFDTPRLRLYCYDHAGAKLWEKSPGEFHSVHGFCSPPVLYKNLVIVNGDQDATAFIVAFDKRTGDEVWRIDRPNKLRSYCPPVIFEVAGKKQMVLTGSKSVASYDPETGKQHWLINGPTEQFVSSMVKDGETLFLTAGFPEHWVMAIKPDGAGNVTKSHVLWSQKNDGGYVPSPVAHAGHFYLVTDDGMASCREAATGNRMWRERLGKSHSGSGIVADGRIYFTDDYGTTFVLKASPEFEQLAKNPLGEKCYSSPAFADGEIVFRGEANLICIAAGKR